MARLALVLLAVLALSSIGLVTAQHKARRLYAQLEHEQGKARQLEIDFAQTNAALSRHGLHNRVEAIATETLGMRHPTERRTRHVPLQGFTGP